MVTLLYHEATDSLYVFGGFRFHVELAAPSPELYSLHCLTAPGACCAFSGAKVRKRARQMSRGWWREGPLLFPCPREWLNPGFLLCLLSSSHLPQVSLLLSDLEVRIIHQEIRACVLTWCSHTLGVAWTVPPFLAPPAMKQGAEVSCASTSKAKSISVSEQEPGCLETAAFSI